MTHHSWLSPRIRGESISGIRLFWFTLLCITRSATLSSLLTLLRAALMIRRKNQTTHTRTYVYIYTWRTGSLESRKSGVIGWSFKRDVGVRSGRSTSEIESWHAIRLDAWLSTFHFPRSSKLELSFSSVRLSSSSSSIFYLLSSIESWIDRWTTNSFRSRNLEDRRSSSIPRIVRNGRDLLGKVIPARRSTDRYQDVRDEARDQPV